jgi:glycosyltransferase involved in cell wall biosynthesis
MKNELMRLSEKLELGNLVRFLGGLTDVRPLLAASDCKILCSAAETFSMAMLEAMAMRVPVVATNVGGCGDAITDGKTGVLITPGNVDELAEKVSALLLDPAGRAEMGRLARETVRKRFSYRNMIAQSGDHLASMDVTN